MGANIEISVVIAAKTSMLVLMLLLWDLQLVCSLRYDDLKSLDASCSPYDTCSLNRTLEEDNLLFMNCECKPSCARYDTCCIDSPHNGQLRRSVQTSNQLAQETCKYVADNSSSVFMVTKCKEGWQEDHDIRSKCQMAYDYRDPYSLVPVTNPETSTTYKNYYCAVCNDDVDNSIPWNLSLSIFSKSVHEKYEDDVAKFFEDIVYNNATSQWGVKVHRKREEKSTPLVMHEKSEDTNNESFESINLILYYSLQLGRSITHCDENLVSNCHSKWKSKTIQNKCHSFMGTVYGTVNASNGFRRGLIKKKFRNVYCAICNFIKETSSINCKDSIALDAVGAQFTIDVNIGKFRKKPVCSAGEVYFHGRCRITG